MSASAPKPKSPRQARRSLHAPAQILKFGKWLSANGAEVLATTNPYELVRFRGETGVSIIYRNDGGRPHKFTGEAFAALWNELNGPESWAANPWVAVITFAVRRCNVDRLGA